MAEKNEYVIPVKWFFDYCDALPKDSPSRYVLYEMWHKYCQYLDRKAKEETHERSDS